MVASGLSDPGGSSPGSLDATTSLLLKNLPPDIHKDELLRLLRTASGCDALLDQCNVVIPSRSLIKWTRSSGASDHCHDTPGAHAYVHFQVF